MVMVMARASCTTLPLCRGELPKSAPVPVVSSIRKGLGPSCCPFALCRKGHVYSMANYIVRNLLGIWRSTRLQERDFHPDFVHEIEWRWMLAFPHALSWYILRTSLAVSCHLGLMPKVSLHGEPYTVLRDPHAFKKSHDAFLPFSLSLTSSLFMALLCWFRRSSRSLVPRRAWISRESLNLAQGTTPFTLLGRGRVSLSDSAHSPLPTKLPTDPPVAPPPPPSLSSRT